MQAVVKRLQVNVRGAQLDHAANDVVHQADDGSFTGQIAQVLHEITRLALAQRAKARFRPLGLGGRLLEQALQRLVDLGGQPHGGQHL